MVKVADASALCDHLSSLTSTPASSMPPAAVGDADPSEAVKHEAPMISRQQTRLSLLHLLGAGYHWSTWTFISIMVFSQFLSVAWDSTTVKFPLLYGQSPVDGPMQIIGYNDVPYDDRVVACVTAPNAIGATFEPWQLSAVKTAKMMTLVDSIEASATGYRIVHRDTTTPVMLDKLARDIHAQSCSLIATTMNSILDACSALGYTNLTRDHLRIVDGIDSNELYEIPDSLPILILPFWDNAPLSRYAIPTWDGDACIFRLDEAYLNAKAPLARFRGVNQTVRHARTIDWLNLGTQGAWRNGWYEDSSEMRWYTDVVSSWDDPRYHMMHRQFDTRTGKEFDCVNSDICRSTMSEPLKWGPKLSSRDGSIAFNSVFAANGTQFGVFLYESKQVRITRCAYDWETLLSNTSVALLLIRWMFSMMALHRGFDMGKSQWHSGGVGCIASSSTFNWLPVVILPRLKSSLNAFWTVGCQFEGQQMAMSEAWFAIYPSIVEVLLVYYSVLNTLAKVFRRRMSDVLFAPTIIALCLLHFFRLELAASGVLHGVDGRIATVVFNDEVERIKLTEYLSTDLALRIGGNVREVFYAKLAILGANLLVLLLARPLPVLHDHFACVHGVEKALALRARHIGGLFSSHSNEFSGSALELSSLTRAVVPFKAASMNRMPENNKEQDSNRGVLLNGYQLLRMGYIVYGNKFLIHFSDWDIITLTAPLRNLHNLWNHRVMVWRLKDNGEAAVMEIESRFPELWRVDDPRLLSAHFWHISACDICC